VGGGAGLATGARSPISEPHDDDNASGTDYDRRVGRAGGGGGSRRVGANDDGGDEEDEDDDDPEDDMEDTATRGGEDREESEDDIDWSWEAVVEWVSSENFWREFVANVIVPLLKGLAWNAGIILSTHYLAKYIVTDMFTLQPAAKPAAEQNTTGAHKLVPPQQDGGAAATASSLPVHRTGSVRSPVAAAAAVAPLNVTHMYYPHFASIMRQSQRYSM